MKIKYHETKINVGSAYQSNNNKKKNHEAEDDCETCACAPPLKKNQ